MSTESRRIEWRVLWSNGMDELFDDESEAIEWVARFSDESNVLTGAIQVRTVTTLVGDWEPIASPSLPSREHADAPIDAAGPVSPVGGVS